MAGALSNRAARASAATVATPLLARNAPISLAMLPSSLARAVSSSYPENCSPLIDMLLCPAATVALFWSCCRLPDLCMSIYSLLWLLPSLAEVGFFWAVVDPTCFKCAPQPCQLSMHDVVNAKHLPSAGSALRYPTSAGMSGCGSVAPQRCLPPPAPAGSRRRARSRRPPFSARPWRRAQTPASAGGCRLRALPEAQAASV